MLCAVLKVHSHGEERQKTGHFFGIGRIDAVVVGEDADGAVHRARVYMYEAYLFCKCVRKRAFAGARGAVDRYYHGLFLLTVFLYAHSGVIPRGKRDLQVKAAGVRVAVDDFACKVQSLDELALHRRGIDLFNVDSAASDDGFVEAAELAGRERETLYYVYQLFSLFSRYRVDLYCAVNAAAGDDDGYQRRRQQI